MDDASAQELRGIVQDLLVVRYAAVAAFVLLAYDYMLTIDDEIRLIWSSRMTIPKFIFLINRYVPIIGIVGVISIIIFLPNDNINTCKVSFVTFSGVVLFGYLTAEAILYMRAYAVWGCQRSTLMFVTAAQIIWYSTGLYFVGRFLASVYILDIPQLPTGCIVGYHDQIEWGAYSCLIGSEITALVLLLIKTFHMRNSTLVNIIFRDGIAYFVVILLSSVANLVVVRVTAPTLCNFLIFSQGALHSICCNRLLLHIRDVYETSLSVPSKQSDINFELAVLQSTAFIA